MISKYNFKFDMFGFIMFFLKFSCVAKTSLVCYGLGVCYSCYIFNKHLHG